MENFSRPTSTESYRKREEGSRSRSRISKPSTRLSRWALAPLSLVFLASACVTTPVTGRSSFNMFSVEQDIELGRAAYEEILAGAELVTSGPELQRVRRVMERLAAAADDAGYEWEVNLIKDDQMVNAFALPGGRMAVYTGILPVCQSDTGLAVVMGHEIGHVVARHGTERMSQSEAAQQLLSAADAGQYGAVAGTALGLLQRPHGRKQESEADHIGVIYMARAGYDPRESVAFWSRMGGGSAPQEASGGSFMDTVGEFLATHPSHETRISDLEKLLPEAIAEYERATRSGQK